jgi:DtxR family Mn-dependent transcriptional regulator
MMQRLAAEGLVDYEPNKGASLTAEGSRAALTTIRRHRLWERFLTDILGLQWDKVHEEACRLEHATSPETEERLAALLGDADTCPHGHPIPDKNGTTKDQKLRPLSDFDVGQTVRISAVAIEEGRLLRKIGKLGLKPRRWLIRQRDREEFPGPGSVARLYLELLQHLWWDLFSVLMPGTM